MICPQIISNKDFDKAIFVHINSGDKSKISDNCFYLLTKLFNQKAFKSQIEEAFILALFEGLSIVREEDILNDIVIIFLKLNMNIKLLKKTYL